MQISGKCEGSEEVPHRLATDEWYRRNHERRKGYPSMRVDEVQRVLSRTTCRWDVGMRSLNRRERAARGLPRHRVAISESVEGVVKNMRKQASAIAIAALIAAMSREVP